ncbi:MAG TPA: helix-turn-helix transcriptional regulator [Chitinophagaceae bacterium]|jgi:DNA-binding NarL/FixJ family response regulator|nr:helix-turn-helix transcriptional regulator [Chitinophagaceae bacterium]
MINGILIKVVKVDDGSPAISDNISSIHLQTGGYKPQLMEFINELEHSRALFELMIMVLPRSEYYKKFKMEKARENIRGELTVREIEVLKLFLNGFTIKEVSLKLFISFETVKSHRKNIMFKTGVKKISCLAKIFSELIEDEIGVMHKNP